MTRTSLFSARALIALACVSAACSGPSSTTYASQEAAIVPTTDSPAWTARLGGTGTDQINAATLDSSGNVVVSGQTSGTFDSQTAFGAGDAFVTKYSATGTKQWTRLVGTTAADVAYGVAVGSSDSIYVSGYLRAGLDGQTALGGTDFWVSKLDSSGTRLWTRLLGAAQNDTANSVAVRSGAVIAAGVTGTALAGNTAAGKTDIALAKWDESGTLAWAKSFGSAQDDSAAGVAIDSSGNAYVAGTAGAALPGATAVGGKDIFLSKYDSSGTRLWTSQIGTAADDTGTGVTIGADGGIYVSGYTAGGLSGSLVGVTDMVLVKFDSSGAVVWTKQLGSPTTDEGLGIASDSSAVYVSGRTLGQLPGANSGGLLNVFAAKYDFSGTLVTVREYSGGNSSGTTVGTAVAASNRRLIIVGASSATAFDGVNTAGGTDGLVLDVCSSQSGFACEFAGSCSTSNGGCTASQTCTPDVTGYVFCGCANGYTGSLVCSDVNECLVNNGGCDSLTTCTNSAGSRTCSACPSGYSGTGATGCTDINECDNNNGNCDPNAYCTNAPGTSSCGACKPGFSGTNATGCVDINECTTVANACDSHTTCTNSPAGDYTCSACPSGYTGTGKTGCVDVDECATTGACDPRTTCTNSPAGDYTCSACPSGFSGTGKTGCSDINECAVPGSYCDVLTTCTNSTGGYTCGACPAGYTGTGATGCVNVNECSAGNGGCDALTDCVDTAGSFFCTDCPVGYQGTGLTGCIAGCATHNGGCDELSTCSDATGSIVCGACPAGYYGTGATGCFGAPTSVSATAADSGAVVSWTAPVAHGPNPLLGFVVTCNPGTHETIVPGGSATSVTVTGLTNGSSYTCTVRGGTASGQGPESSATSSFTPVGVPNAPTGVTATRGNASAVVAFTAPSNNGGSPITLYTAEASPGSAKATTTIAGTPLTIVGLTNGTNYSVSVYATNNYGAGARSSSASVTPATTPGAPTAVTGTPGNGSVAVSWTAPASNGGSGISQSVVTASPGGATTTVTGAGTSATVTGLTNGSSYTFTVVSSNDVGSGPTSTASAAIIPRTVPGVPTAVVATAANASATVSWAAPASNGGAAITTYTVTGTYASGSVTKSISGTSTTVTGLTNGVAYTFVVKGCNAAGCGANSAAAPAVTPFTLATAPLNVVATAGDGEATVSWSAPTSTGGFTLQNYTVLGGPAPLTLSGTSTVVTGLTNGVTYNFSVVANTSVGSGTPGWASPVTPQSASCESPSICSDSNGGCAAYQACSYDGCHRLCGCPSGLVDNGSSCVAVGPAWTVRPGTSAADQVNATAIDSAGNVIVAGQTAGALDGQTNAGVQDGFITKYSSTGTRLWTRLFGSTLSDGANGVAIGTSDSIYAVGFARGSIDGQTFAGGVDAMVVKYDSSGNRVWTRLFGTSGTENALAVAVRGGSVYVGGYTSLNLAGSTRGGANDAVIARYDESGTLQWAKSFGTAQDDLGNGITVDSSGNAYLTGTTSGSLPGFTSAGGKDIFLAKYNSAGTRTNLIQGGSDLDDNGAAVAVGADDSLYLAGSSRSADTGNDAAMFIFNSAMEIQGQAILSTSAQDDAAAVAVDVSGVYLVGRTLGQFEGANAYGDLNVFVAHFDPASGSLVKIREYAGNANTTGTTFGMGVAVASGRVVIGGYASGTFDNVAAVGGIDGLVLDVCNGPNFACELSGSCTTSNGGCTATQTCTGASSSKVFCSCGSGYTGSVTCTDVNECRSGAGNGGCDALTTCTNTPGSRVCGACPSGYTGTGASGCVDINECDTGNGGCDLLSSCTNNAGAAPTCGACPYGYNGTGATGCTDIDECATNNGNCDALTTCTNNPGDLPSCGACPSGYSGTGFTGCSDINECETNNGGCGELTNCINSIGAFSCGTVLTASPSVVTIGGESSIAVRLRMLDPSGNPQFDQPVTVTLSGSDNTISPASGFTDSSGLFYTVLTSKVPGEKSLSVTGGEQTLTTSVLFLSPQACTGTVALSTPIHTLTGGTADALTTGDFNGDGKLDVVVTDSGNGTVITLLGNGDNTFGSPISTNVGEDVPSITHGDLNQDGHLDIVVLNAFYKTVQFFAGAGNGTFPVGMTMDLPATPQAAVVADFNGDGAPDVFIATTNNKGYLVASTGTGDFSSPAEAIANASQLNDATRLATADWNGDGLPDVVVGVETSGTESQMVLINGGDGTFSASAGFSSGSTTAFAVGDFDADGYADVARGTLTGVASYQAGTGATSSALKVSSTSGNTLMVASDLNGDGRDDLALAYGSGLGLSLSQSSGGFQTTTQASSTVPSAVATGDFNGDGRLDVVTIASDVYVFPNTCAVTD